MKKQALTDLEIKRAQPQAKKYGLNDGYGLWLIVWPSGLKSWVYFYTEDKKPKQSKIGEYPVLSLAQAREELLQIKRKRHSGIDFKKKVGTNEMTFFEAFNLWFNHWRIGQKPDTEKDVLAMMEKHVFPILSCFPITTLKPRNLKNIAIDLQNNGLNATARKVIIYCKKIFRYDPVEEVCPLSPFESVRAKELLRDYEVKNRSRINNMELKQFIQDINQYPDMKTRLALQLMLHFWTRTMELLAAKWEEFDFESGYWVIPKERMKKKRPHVVPLSDQAIEKLKCLRALFNHGDWLFFDFGNINKSLILNALYDMGYKGKMTGHGFRGLAATELHRLGFDKNLIKIQLSHSEDKSLEAYILFDCFEQRQKLMQGWADHIESLSA
jgi:integrase